MDAVPAIIGESLGGAFNNTHSRNEDYKAYFSKLRKEYINRYQVFKSLIMGIDSIDKEHRSEVLSILWNNSDNKDYFKLIESGINGVNIMKNLEPEAGFFLLLNFNELKGKHYNDFTINNEFDLLKYFYNDIKLRYILGSGCLWPNEEDLIGRFTFAKPYKELIEVSTLMDQSTKKLVR